MKFRNPKHLPERFSRWLQFELGGNLRFHFNLFDNDYQRDTFTEFMFGNKLNEEHKQLAPVSNVLFYYNQNVFGLNDDVSDISNLDFFLNDINLLDDFILNSHLTFREHFQHFPIERPVLSSVFHFDNHPFYETYMEPEFLYLSMHSDNLLSTKFTSSLEKPLGVFLTPRTRKEFWDNRILSMSDVMQYFNFYYLSRSFLSILMDEERFYVTWKRISKSLFRLFLVFIIFMVMLYHIAPIIHFLINKFTWKLFYCNASEAYRKLTLFAHNPLKMLKFWGWNVYLVFKLSFIYVHDFAVALYFLKHPKKQSKYWIIDERNKPRKRYKHSDLLNRWF